MHGSRINKFSGNRHPHSVIAAEAGIQKGGLSLIALFDRDPALVREIAFEPVA